MTFREFVHTYGLTRVRGRGAALPVRRRSRRCAPGVPAAARTEEVTDLVEWLGELVRQVDSSLLDEWEQLTSPDPPLDAPVAVPARPRPAHRQRAGVHRDGAQRAVPAGGAVGAGAAGTTSASWTPASGWDADRWGEVVQAYFADHDEVRTGADARGPALLVVDKSDPRRVAGAADPRRPGRRPRLGLRRRGRPRRLRRGGLAGDPPGRRRPQGLKPPQRPAIIGVWLPARRVDAATCR